MKRYIDRTKDTRWKTKLHIYVGMRWDCALMVVIQVTTLLRLLFLLLIALLVAAPVALALVESQGNILIPKLAAANSGGGRRVSR